MQSARVRICRLCCGCSIRIAPACQSHCSAVRRVRAFAAVWRTCKSLAGAAGTRQPSFLRKTLYGQMMAGIVYHHRCLRYLRQYYFNYTIGNNTDLAAARFNFWYCTFLISHCRYHHFCGAGVHWRARKTTAI